MEQGTKAWLELRKNYIGSSDAPVIMEVSPWTTPFQLWEEKLGLGEEKEDNWAMKRGRELEPIAREAYIEFTGNFVEPAVVFDSIYDFRMASLDGITKDGNIVVEIKNVNEADHLTAIEGKIPEKYIPQCQHILDVTKARVLHYWSFRNDEGVLVEIIRDEKYCRRLLQKEKEFREKIVDFTPPSFSESDYVDYDGDFEWEEIVREAQEIKTLEEEIKERKEKNRERFHEKIKGHNGKGAGAKFFKVVETGRIDYKKLIDFLNVPKNIVEEYRKPPIIKWNFRGKSEKQGKSKSKE